jgi:hypothetical protein
LLHSPDIRRHSRHVRSVVVAVHSQTDSENFTTYTYTLRSIDGPPIRRDLGTGPHDQFTVGQRITVLADPFGESAPSLQLQVSTLQPWVWALVLIGILVVGLLGAPGSCGGRPVCAVVERRGG